MLSSSDEEKQYRAMVRIPGYSGHPFLSNPDTYSI
jgi:hypothetical protein